MKPFGKCKINGATVKKAARRFDFASEIANEICITKYYNLRPGEWFAKETKNANLAITNISSAYYITKAGVIMYEGDDFDFVDSWDTPWFVLNVEPKHPLYEVQISMYKGCQGGFLNYVNSLPNNPFFNYIKKHGLRLPWFLKNKTFKVRLSDEMAEHFHHVSYVKEF
jgi:hypothetical protein